MAKPNFLIGTASAEPGTRAFGMLELGELAYGTRIAAPLILTNGAQEGPRLLLVGGIHGEEVTGTEAAKRIATEIDPGKLRGILICVPCINIPAALTKTRLNQFDRPWPGSQDLNRVFPGNPDGTLTERIAHAFVNEAVLKSDYVVDLHSGTHDDWICPHVTMIPEELPVTREVREKTEAMCKAWGTEVIRYTKEWQFGRQQLAYMAPLKGIPTITLDTGTANRLGEVEISMKGIKNILKHLGMIDGRPDVPDRYYIARRYRMITCNHGGMLHLDSKPGDKVSNEQLLAHITNLYNQVIEEIRAPFEGLVFTLALSAIVKTGDYAVVLVAP
jgi:predicted deacylase